MSVLYVDVVGGAAGDMLLAALVDAGADRAVIAEAVSSVLGRRIELETSEVQRKELRSLELVPPEELFGRRRSPAELLAAVERAGLDERVRERSEAILVRLFDAEAHVHGVPGDELELEELGEDDTLFDVVGIAAALEALAVERVYVSPVPMPLPSADGDHGSPAPVTLELLAGFTLRPSEAGSEMAETVTPTAAAVFAALGEPAPEIPELTLRRIGYGAGVLDPRSVANLVRVLVGEALVDDEHAHRLLLVETNVDDLTPELVPDAVDAILSAGALDAWAAPIVMKRGRPALAISALCDQGALAEVKRAFFEATTTLGVRVRVVARSALDRKILEVDLVESGPRIRVKIGFLDGEAVTAKPEHADVLQAAAKLGRSVRSVHAQASALAYSLLQGENAG